jgi:hypothetical protein
MTESELIAEQVGRVTVELFDRLECDLDYSDMLALQSAVTKAAVAGFREGVAHIVYSALGQGVVIDHAYSGDGDHDPWAEEFGDE